MKIELVGESSFPMIMGTTTMVSSSPDNSMEPVSYIKIQEMGGIIDYRRFDADTYFCMVNKYGKMPTD